jgi:hypothetical protein
MTSTACLKQPSARMLVRVPRRSRSACSRLDRYDTVSSRTVKAALFVTLMSAQNSYKVDRDKTIFIPGFCVFLLALQRFRRVAAHLPRRYGRSPQACAERLIVRTPRHRAVLHHREAQRS